MAKGQFSIKLSSLIRARAPAVMSSSFQSSTSTTSSVWITSSTDDIPSYPHFQGTDQHVDVCVVGGGIFGVTTAYKLHKAGKKVALLEARKIGQGTTGYSTAKLTSNQSIIYSNINAKHGKETARLYGQMQEGAIADVVKLVSELKINCELEKRSHVTWTSDEKKISQIDKEVEIASELGLPVTKAIPSELPSSLNVKAALVFKNQVQFNPYAFCTELAKHITGQSVVYENSRVTQISNSSPHTITCEDVGGNGHSSLTADTVILATHLPILDRSQHFAVLIPSRSHCIAVRMSDKSSHIHDMYINLELPGKRSMRSTKDGSILVVSGEPYKVGDETQTEELYEALEEWARKHFKVAERVAKWSSIDYYSGDLLPYIGQLYRGSSTIYTATGFSKWGLTNGVAAAQIITDMINGDKNPYQEMVDARRWDLLKAGAGIASEAWHVAKHMVGDKISSFTAPDIKTLKKGTGAIVTANHKTVAAYLDEAGQYHVVSPVCTHLGCTIVFNEGDKIWDCPCHGSQFDIEGVVLHGPACKNLAKIAVDW